MALDSLLKEAEKIKGLYKGEYVMQGKKPVIYYRTGEEVAEKRWFTNGHYFGIGFFITLRKVGKLEKKLLGGKYRKHYYIRVNRDLANDPLVIDISDGTETYRLKRDYTTKEFSLEKCVGGFVR